MRHALQDTTPCSKGASHFMNGFFIFPTLGIITPFRRPCDRLRASKIIRIMPYCAPLRIFVSDCLSLPSWHSGPIELGNHYHTTRAMERVLVGCDRNTVTSLPQYMVSVNDPLIPDVSQISKHSSACIHQQNIFNDPYTKSYYNWSYFTSP